MNNNNSNSNKNLHQQQHHHHHYGNEFSLFVGDLPDDCSDNDLRDLFQAKYKSVKRVQIIKNEDGKSRGFGFIRFEDRNDFQAALSQEMRFGNKPLRLDTAHRSFKNRTRYPSINSSGSNSSHQQNHHSYSNNNSNNNNNNSNNNGGNSGLHHHHHPHHNQSHHHQNNPSHQHHMNSTQQQQGQKNKTLAQDQLMGSQQSHLSSSSDVASRVSNPLHHGLNAASSGPSTVHHHPHAPHHQQHNSSHNAHLNHSLFNPSQQKSSQHQQTADNRSPKQQPQSSLTLGGDDAISQSQAKQSLASPTNPLPNLIQQTPTQPPRVGGSSIGLSVASSATITATSTQAVTSLSNSDSVTQSSGGLVTNQANLNATGPNPITHDYRGYPPSAMLEGSHLMGATDPASVVPPSSVYGHIYPYGHPSHFGYMPPPQPNPVIPISAGPPLSSSQGSSATGVGPHPLPAANTSRFGSTPHQQHHHTQQHLAGVPEAGAMNTMTAGVQASHQAPFYYYYPNPFYFDQSGAGAPPNMYHPQAMHPPFFALPNPAFMPNAHTYTNQQQTQPPTAPQSEASTIAALANQTQPQQPPQSQQQQLTIRTRDIDAPTE